MVRVFATQTIEVDPRTANATQPTNVNLAQAFSVLGISIVSTTTNRYGVTSVTLGIVYDNAVTAQASYSFHIARVGADIDEITNTAIGDIQTVKFTKFVPLNSRTNTLQLAVITISTIGVQVNSISTAGFLLDPTAPITAGAIAVTGTILDSALISVGSLVHVRARDTNDTGVGAGSQRAVSLVISQA